MSSRNVPASLMHLGAINTSTPLVPRTLTLWNLTVQSLFLAATQGSALLSFERARPREARRTVSLIESDKTSSYSHSLLEACVGGLDESRGGVCLVWIGRCSSVSCPFAARWRCVRIGYVEGRDSVQDIVEETNGV